MTSPVVPEVSNRKRQDRSDAALDRIELTAAAEAGGQQDAEEDLQLMQHDPSVHVSPALLSSVLKLDELTVEYSAVYAHLSTCEWCRGSLDAGIRLCGLGLEHPAQQLLRQAHERLKWIEAARVTAARAREGLHERGLGYVYSRDGVVYERLPNGEEHVLHVQHEEPGEEPCA